MESRGKEFDWVADQEKRLNMYAFPGRQHALIGTQEIEVPTNGLTKREYFAMHFMASLSYEYVKKPGYALMEIMASTAIKMTDELLKQLEK